MAAMAFITRLSILLLACFRFSAATWERLPDIPIAPRQENTAVFLPPDDIVIMGGIAPKGNTTTTTDLVQIYSISGRTWKTVAPLPIPLNHPNAAVIGGKIYVLGGLAETSTAWNATPACWIYDPEVDVWTTLDDMVNARGSAAIGAWESKIILAGGLKQIQLVSPYAQDTVPTVSIYDTGLKTWTKGPDLPDARDHAGAAIVDEKFYVLGGRANGSIRGKNTTLVLDLNNTDAGWTVLDSQMPTARSGLSVGVVGSKIYTFGGEGNLQVDSGVFNQTEVYDVVIDIWETLGEMKVPRHGTAGVSAEGKFYIPGGGVTIGIGPTTYFDAFVLKK